MYFCYSYMHMYICIYILIYIYIFINYFCPCECVCLCVYICILYHISVLYIFVYCIILVYCIHGKRHMHVRAYAESEREPRCTRACAWRMWMGHMHVQADGHSGHVLVECVRADCLLVSCSGASTCTATRSACCRRASLTSSRRLGE